jgi:hypothetical protein
LEKIKNKLYLCTFILLIIILFFTKSAWGIIVFIIFLFYKLFNKNIIKNKYFYFSLIPIIFILFFYYPEKIQSFISRFYIWETTLNIIFSDIKNIIFGSGLASLENIFDSYKVKELFLFENF